MLFTFEPIVREVGVDFERDFEIEGGFHFVDDELEGGVSFVDRRFEDELIMNLEEHARVRELVREFAIEIHHGEFDEVGGRPLHDGVDRHAFAEHFLAGVS